MNFFSRKTGNRKKAKKRNNSEKKIRKKENIKNRQPEKRNANKKGTRKHGCGFHLFLGSTDYDFSFYGEAQYVLLVEAHIVFFPFQVKQNCAGSRGSIYLLLVKAYDVLLAKAQVVLFSAANVCFHRNTTVGPVHRIT